MENRDSLSMEEDHGTGSLRAMVFCVIAAVCLIALFPGRGMSAAHLKVTSVRDLSQLGRASPHPYGADADADRSVDGALAVARAERKLVFIDLGGNWSPDSRLLARFMQLPEIKRFVAAHYVVVHVNVGHFNKNLQIPARWGIVGPLAGSPAVLIIDPADNSLVDRSQFVALARVHEMRPQQIADWMVHWVCGCNFSAASTRGRRPE